MFAYKAGKADETRAGSCPFGAKELPVGKLIPLAAPMAFS